MKKIYWRPHRVSRVELVLIAVIAVVGVFLSETFLVREKQPFYKEKLEAARLSRTAMKTIKQERLRKGIKIDKEADPAESGMIGVLMSAVTTNSGHLQAKQTSINPNFAAVIVHMLKRAEVEEGDFVAVGLSSSFPAMNVHVYSALQTLNLEPVVISSVSGSQWGANMPNFLWVDMERLLYEQKVFRFRSIAASRGGVDDRALGLSKWGKRLLDDSIERNDIQTIKPENYEDSLNKRMQIYNEALGDGPFKAYINVGGGTISVGTAAGKRAFRPGLNRKPPYSPITVDSVIGRMSLDGIPVIHLVQIDRLAERYGLPLQPLTIPPIGEGQIFYKMEYSEWLPPVMLGIILLAMFAFIRMDWGFRIFQVDHSKTERKPPEQMV